MKLKNIKNGQFIYIIFIFLFFYFIRNIFNRIKSTPNKNSYTSFVPSNMMNITNDNLYSLQNDNSKQSMMYDSYQPRFIAPRYYDTQYYNQPVYTRTYGNDMYFMKQRHKNRKQKRYVDESSSDSDDM